jgi:hypothetical protein
MFTSCEKTFDDKLVTNQDLNNSAVVQVYNAIVNSARNYVYVDGNPVTGALLVPGSVFPAFNTGIGFNLSGGLHNFTVKDTLRTSTQVQINFAEDLQAKKYYTVFLYDTISSPKQKTVLTNIEVPTDTSARLRFANFIYNPSAVPNIDVFSYVKNANIFTNIPVTGVTDFIPYPAQFIGPDTLYIRETGTTVNIIKFPIVGGTAPTFVPKRSYTLVYRGSHRGTRIASIFPNY